MQLAGPLRNLAARHLAEPIVEPAEDGEHGAHAEHVVEVRDHIVGVVHRQVHARVGQHHAGHPAQGEQEDEPDGPQHGRVEAQGTAPHGRDPGEYLDPGRHRDDQGRGDEVGPRVDIHADGVHVVRPDDEADDADRHHGVDHAQVAEHRLPAEGRDDHADDAEARQDHDVDLGVPEEPEQVLEQDRIAAAGRIEERGAEVAVGQEHGDGAAEHRQRQEQQEGGDQDRPDEQRHLVERHARRAHVEDRGDEVDRAQDRRRAGQVEREDRHVDRGPGMAERGR